MILCKDFISVLKDFKSFKDFEEFKEPLMILERKEDDAQDVCMNIMRVSLKKFYEGKGNYHFYNPEVFGNVQLAIIDMQDADKSRMPVEVDGRALYEALPWKAGVFLEC